MNQFTLVQILVVWNVPTWVIITNFCSYDIQMQERDLSLEVSLLQVAIVILLPKESQGVPNSFSAEQVG